MMFLESTRNLLYMNSTPTSGVARGGTGAMAPQTFGKCFCLCNELMLLKKITGG